MSCPKINYCNGSDVKNKCWKFNNFHCDIYKAVYKIVNMAGVKVGCSNHSTKREYTAIDIQPGMQIRYTIKPKKIDYIYKIIELNSSLDHRYILANIRGIKRIQGLNVYSSQEIADKLNNQEIEII